MTKRRARPDPKRTGDAEQPSRRYERSKPDPLHRSITGAGFATMSERMSAEAREQRMRDFVEVNERAIVDAVVRRAKAGDMAAAKLALDYAHPPPGSRLTPFPMLLVGNPQDAVTMMEHALMAVGIGRLTIAEAERLFRLVQMYISAHKTLPKLGPAPDPEQVRQHQEEMAADKEKFIAEMETMARRMDTAKAEAARAQNAESFGPPK